MVGTGANRMPLTKIHPILLGKQKSEGTSLLAQHRQQFEERRQDQQQQMGHNQHMGGPRPPQHPPQPPPQMQPPLPPQPSHQAPGFRHQPPQPSFPPQPMGYPPPGMYQQRPPVPFPPHGQPVPQPPPPGFGSPAQPPPPVGNSYDRKSPPRSYNRDTPRDNRGSRDTRDNNRDTRDNNRDTRDNNRDTRENNRDTRENNRDTRDNNRDTRDNNRDNNRDTRDNNRDTNDSRDTRASRDTLDARDIPSSNSSTPDSSAPVKKKRKSRWGAIDDKAVLTGPMTLPANLTEEQRKQYLIQFKIEEITQKLRTGELGIPLDPGDRSPSPEPIYNSEGKRLNTREFRVRKALEEERHVLIKQAVDEIPNYKPPIDYKPPASKICDKVFIPSERNPAVNFIGLLIGPRGNTLKRLEKETGCKIIIRGKGSVKEGKVGRIPGQLMPGEDEPLHALITGPSEAEVKKGVQVVGDIVKEGIECPDAANELRRNQLRELAELNGTLIDDEVIKCKNCGATDHRHWECTERKNVTSEITCNKCGGYGHVAADCKVKVEENSMPTQTFAEKAKMDTEYMSLMAELGVDAPPPPPKRVFQENPQTSAAATSTSLPPPANLLRPPTSTMNIPPPNMSLNRVPPPPNMNVPPPMNTPPPGLPEPPKENRNSQPSNDSNGRAENPNKWGPPASSAPQSLMDVNVGPTSGNSSMASQNQFSGPRPDGVRVPRPDSVRGPRPDGVRGPRPDGVRGPRPDGVRGPRPDGVRGPRPDGVRGPRPDGVRGPRPDGVHGPRPDGVRGPRPDGMRGPRPDGPQGIPPPWRNRGPTPLMQAQTGPPPGRGNPVPPWHQQGPNRGPPPNANYGPPTSNSGYGPPPPNPRMDHPTGNNTPRAPSPHQPVGYPNRWSQPYSFNPNQMPPSTYGNIPPPWAQQPPPPPPPPAEG